MSKTVVCIHGAGGGGWEYAKWQPVFEKAGYHFIAHDLQPSLAGLAATTFEGYVEQIRAWLPSHGPLILVGASMGGMLAMKVAEQLSPTALVLVNSVAPAGLAPSRPPKQYPPIIEWADGSLQDTRDALFDSDEATIRWAWPRWRDESGVVLQAISNGIPAQPPTCPTLVVLGTDDTDIPYQTGLAIAQWASADVHLYHGMSHVGPLLSRRAEEVAAAVVGWCQIRFND